MKKKIIILALAAFCSVLVLLVGSSFSPAPASEPGSGGCTGPFFCPMGWDGDDWVYYNNKGLQEPPWFQCCGQACSSSEQGKTYEEEPIEG